MHLKTARTFRPRLRCMTSKREMASSPSTCQRESCPCSSRVSHRVGRLSFLNLGGKDRSKRSNGSTRDLLSRFFIVYREDDPSNISNRVCSACAEVKQAQREAKKDAERIVAEEDRPDTNEMSEGRSADRSYIPSHIGTDVDEDETGVFPDKPEEDADAIHLLLKATCVDEPNEASYLSGSSASYFSKCGRYLPTTRQTSEASITTKTPLPLVSIATT